MNEGAAVVLGAVAALVGVLISQVVTLLSERLRQIREDKRRSFDVRLEAYSQFISKADRVEDRHRRMVFEPEPYSDQIGDEFIRAMDELRSLRTTIDLVGADAARKAASAVFVSFLSPRSAYKEHPHLSLGILDAKHRFLEACRVDLGQKSLPPYQPPKHLLPAHPYGRSSGKRSRR
jgi:hypothetical protein